MKIRQTHKQLFTAAIMAAMGLGAGAPPLPVQGRDSVTIPIHKAPANVKRGEAAEVERMLCAPIKNRSKRKPWPFSGKNKAQRQRLSAGFMSM